MSGIDDIVEMVIKEAMVRDRHDFFKSLYDVLWEVNHKAVNILVQHLIDERRREEDENKG